MATRKKKTPAKGKRTARRQRVVADVVAGKSPKKIAAEENCSRGTVYNDVASAEGQFEIAQILDARRERLERLVDRALVEIEGGLGAMKTFVVNAGMLDGEALGSEIYETDIPDFAVRLGAVNRLHKFFMVGRAPKKAVEQLESRQKITYDEFKELLGSFPRGGKP